MLKTNNWVSRLGIKAINSSIKVAVLKSLYREVSLADKNQQIHKPPMSKISRNKKGRWDNFVAKR